MVLRKPYAFLIKHFKLFHVFLSGILIAILMQISRVMAFISEYLNSNATLITVDSFEKLYGLWNFLLPVIVFIFSIVLFSVMTLKKKPNKYYLFSLIASILLLFLNVYGYYTLKALTEVWLEVNRLSVLSDLYSFMLVVYIALCFAAISRAFGFNISRFDFNSDISNFELTEKDNEEFEVSIDFDVNDVKRNAKKQLRYAKYFYKENKKTIFYVAATFALIVVFYGVFSYLKYAKDIKKGNILTYNGFSVKVNGSYIIDSGVDGKKFNGNVHLLVVDADITNNNSSEEMQFITGTVSVNIGSESYTLTKQYENDVIDFGKIYNEDRINAKTTVRRLFVFEIPVNHLFSKTLFGISEKYSNKTHYIRLNPSDYSDAKNKVVEAHLNDTIDLSDSTIKNAKININKFDVASKYKLNYKYCYSKTKCIDSTEYIVPNNGLSNYDKTILYINGDFNFDKNYLINDFFNLLNTFGYIEYEVDGKTYKQTSFRKVVSSRVKVDNSYYIEVPKTVENASSICIGFKIRNIDYRYFLK